MSGASKYVGLLFQSREKAHMYHLMTKSFAEHKALQAYYEGIVPLADSYAEAYMGKYGPIRKMAVRRSAVTRVGARAYFKSLLARLRTCKLPRDSYLRNIQDEITALVRSTLYMLTLK